MCSPLSMSQIVRVMITTRMNAGASSAYLFLFFPGGPYIERETVQGLFHSFGCWLMRGRSGSTSWGHFGSSPLHASRITHSLVVCTFLCFFSSRNLSRLDATFSTVTHESGQHRCIGSMSSTFDRSNNTSFNCATC
jgi:hypothetical protein